MYTILNTELFWAQPEPPYQQITQAQADAYRHEGGFILENAFTQTEINRLIEALDPMEAEANAHIARMSSDQPSIARADEIVFGLMLFYNLLRRNISPNTGFCSLVPGFDWSSGRVYWDQLVYKRPGTAQEFPWHQDNGYTFVTPQQYLTCWVALTDATTENGCPWIAPGLHRPGNP